MAVTSRTEPLLSTFYQRLRPRPALQGVPALFAATDIVSIFAASFAAELLYDALFQEWQVEPSRAIVAAAATGSLFVLSMHSSGLYAPTSLLATRSQVSRALCHLLTVVGFLAILVFTLKISPMFSRVATGFFVIIGGVILSAQRIAIANYLQHSVSTGTFSGPKIILINCCRNGQDRVTGELGKFGFDVVESLILPAGASAAKIGEVAKQALTAIRGSLAGEVFITADCESLKSARPMLELLKAAPLPVRLVLNERTTELFSHDPKRIGALSTFEVKRAPLTLTERSLKRGLDIAVAIGALLALLPLFIFVAIAVKFDSPGPVFFRQRRNGFNCRSFRIYKFRSMTVLEDGASVVQARKGDARFTRAGKWLRKTSIDELPQLLNVLSGEMSIVGPRPHALSHDDYYAAELNDYAFRQHVKPGITGWAQIHGHRGETTTVNAMSERVRYDIWYINHWSIWLDLTIIIRTGLALTQTKNTY